MKRRKFLKIFGVSLPIMAAAPLAINQLLEKGVKEVHYSNVVSIGEFADDVEIIVQNSEPNAWYCIYDSDTKDIIEEGEFIDGKPLDLPLGPKSRAFDITVRGTEDQFSIITEAQPSTEHNIQRVYVQRIFDRNYSI